MLKKDNQDRIHVGIHDYFKEGEWLTIFDEPLNETGYETWVTSNGEKQPDNHLGNEHCGSFTRWYDVGYNDINCNLTLSYVCELPHSSVFTLQEVL